MTKHATNAGIFRLKNQTAYVHDFEYTSGTHQFKGFKSNELNALSMTRRSTNLDHDVRVRPFL